MFLEITPKEAADSLKVEEAILIDVREQGEYNEWHIKDAQLAPLSNLPQAIQEIHIPKDKKIIFYCLKGGRSAEAIMYLQENLLKGHDLYNMQGGILAWQADQLPIETN